MRFPAALSSLLSVALSATLAFFIPASAFATAPAASDDSPSVSPAATATASVAAATAPAIATTTATSATGVAPASSAGTQGMLISGNDHAVNQTVKAGVFAFDGYHMMDENGELYGYGIEVLEMISKYSHLNFDLVAYESSWRDMLDMLESGEIDVVTSASKTSEREAIFDYSLPIGKKSTVLSVAVDDERFVPGNYRTYNGMVIGEIPGNTQNDIFAEFANDKGFGYTVVQFEDNEALTKALQNGEVDAILTSDLRKRENEKTIETLESDSYYAMVRKGDTALLNEINYAIEQMNITEGDWQNILHYKYYGPSYSSQFEFTERELAYIDEVRAGTKKITATAFADRRPYSYEEDGELTGILLDYFAAVMAIADVPYEILVPRNLTEYEQLIEYERVNVILDNITGEDAVSEYFDDGFSSDIFMDASVVQVARTDFAGEVETIAVSDSSTGSLDAFLATQEGKTLLHYPDREAALRAVLDGEADCAYVYVYTAQEFMNRDMTNSLSYSAVYGLDVQFDLRISANADHELVSILNKCIKQVPEATLNAIVSEYTYYDANDLTVFQYLQANPAVLAVLLLLLILIAGVIVTLVYRGRQKEALAVALEQAQYANNAKTTFLNSMSHDIRTPMNAIIGFTTLAEKHIDDTEQVEDYLGKILTSSNHLLSLINDVLDMSRIESGKVTINNSEASLSGILQDLSMIVQSDVTAKGLAFEVDTSGIVDDMVVCDKLRLSQVLLNIISNAIKYTQDGGSVSASVVQVGPLQPDGMAEYRFVVKDTGIGMSEQFLEHVFEPFEREETATVSGIQGTGLGLSITKNLVDMMGGTIAASSVEGEGSEFVATFRFLVADEAKRVKVPGTLTHSDEATADAATSNDDVARGIPADGSDVDAVAGDASAVGGSDTGAGEGSVSAGARGGVVAVAGGDAQDAFGSAADLLKGKHVLLVEDNAMSREMARIILEDAEIVVDAVEDGTYAVERMKEKPAGTYDVVLTDVQMPIMDGYETTRAIRALEDSEKASIPIIAVTANAFDEDREEAEEAGMSGYIPKPINIEQLFEVLKKFLKE